MEKLKLSSNKLDATIFHFKQFAVLQNSSVFKVNTDAVLLASVINEIAPRSILEIGCGTGVISMCLKQKYNHSTIVGIDISKEAVELFQENIKLNKLSNIFSFHYKLQEYITTEHFDLIVSNPPFFNNGMVSQKKHNINARHTSTLSFEDLLSHASRLLTKEGSFWIIVPSDEVEYIDKISTINQLYIQKKIIIFPKPEKSSKRTILCFSKLKKTIDTGTVSTLTILDENHEYSNDYKTITKNFYLKF